MGEVSGTTVKGWRGRNGGKERGGDDISFAKCHNSVFADQTERSLNGRHAAEDRGT